LVEPNANIVEGLPRMYLLHHISLRPNHVESVTRTFCCT